MNLQGSPVPDAIQIAGEAVAQCFAAVKVDMTAIESSLWAREIQRIGASPVLSFVELWLSGGAPGSSGSFRRAPTIEDLLHHADPCYVSSASALEVLRREVAATGPWADPRITDPKLRETVKFLGGWAKVCQDMPDPSDDFAFKRFAERFKTGWSHSQALQVQKALAPPALRGLVASPNQLQLAMDIPADDAPS